MDYFKALSMYQDFCVSVQYAELKKQTREEALKETAGKYTFKQVLDCFESLLKELDEKKEHYMSLFKIIGMIKRDNGEKLEVEE
jgi:hypothetical protein